MDIQSAQTGQTKMWWIARGFAFASWVFVGAVMLSSHSDANTGKSANLTAPVAVSAASK